MADQAFPFLKPHEDVGTYIPGMTLRDYFAAAAMQGVLVGTLTPQACWSPRDVAETAYGMADAMMEERK
jgi:hypothetical protein